MYLLWTSKLQIRYTIHINKIRIVVKYPKNQVNSPCVVGSVPPPAGGSAPSWSGDRDRVSLQRMLSIATLRGCFTGRVAIQTLPNLLYASLFYQGSYSIVLYVCHQGVRDRKMVLKSGILRDKNMDNKFMCISNINKQITRSVDSKYWRKSLHWQFELNNQDL